MNRVLLQKDVRDFADMHNVIADECDGDDTKLTIVKHLRQFLSRADVLDALSATEAPRAPSAPELMSAEFTKLHLRWADDNAVDHGLRYDLQIGRRFVGGWQIFRDLQSNQFAITDLQQASTFVVRVRAMNPLGWSEWSERTTVETARPTLTDMQQSGQKMGFFQIISAIPEGYEELINAIIRPPRTSYSVSDLGASRFRLEGAIFQRTDFTLVNPRGQTLRVSHWEPSARERPKERMPAVIYCHGNCGCRCDSIECLEAVLTNGCTLVGFDFAGSGNSDGEYISLGWWERDDVEAIAAHLRASGTVSHVCGWGRSMGAATCLMYSARASGENELAAMVTDSPFADLWQLALELVASTELKIPTIAVSTIKMVLRRGVRKRANFDVLDLSPIAAMRDVRTPCLFAAANGDDFIQPHHTASVRRARHHVDARSADELDAVRAVLPPTTHARVRTHLAHSALRSLLSSLSLAHARCVARATLGPCRDAIAIAALRTAPRSVLLFFCLHLFFCLLVYSFVYSICLLIAMHRAQEDRLF
jgi:hypothetical protein